MTKNEFHTIEKKIRERMEAADVNLAVIQEFLRRVHQVYSGATGKLAWKEVGDLKEGDLIPFEKLPPVQKIERELNSLIVIKLNGGLGTSMGLAKAKSLIPIRGEKNFLQIISRQIGLLRQSYGATVPIFFMNSFNTREDTLNEAGIAKLNHGLLENLPVDFLQNRVPRLYRDSFLPMETDWEEQAWCPPGHGDVFFALKSNGLLDHLLRLGYRTAFISNGDNLGAVVESRILDYFHREKLEWLSEVTYKTPADRKGGTLFRRTGRNGEGTIELLEIAQVADEHIDDFQDIGRFAYFNVNNLWVDLKALNAKLNDASLDLALIVNPKKVVGREILQLETAMGAAINCFEKSRVVLVPRNRFSPVKTCADLLVRRSDAYTLEPNSYALLPHNEQKIPLVLLGPAYKSVENFEKLFPVVPSLKDATCLEIEGRLCFDLPVKIRGSVRFKIKGEREFNISELGRQEFKEEEILM